MSYDVQLYRVETKTSEQQSNDADFFDHEENLVPFTEQQFDYLKERLQKYGYVLHQNEDKEGHFTHPDYTITVLLTDRGLYFSAGFGAESIFEAGMTASEFTDTEEFAKYDSQSTGWEEI